MKTQFTLATIGFGGRGKALTKAFLSQNDAVKLIAVVEPRAEIRRKCMEDYAIAPDMAFTDYDAFFEKGVTADILIVATMDVLHHDPAVKAMKLGYRNIVLEKPIAVTLEECKDIVNTAIAHDVNMAVCHSLRYDPFWTKLKEVIDSGIIGKIMNIQHVEGAGFMNYVHSFVRGHMRNTELSAPLIMQKSCHDFDMLVYLTGKKYKRVSSFGELTYFKEENAPAGSGTMCTVDCQCADTCIYNAYNLYSCRMDSAYTDAAIREGGYRGLDYALATTDYGKCVYRCDNNVCDHQVVNIEFDDNTTGSLTVSGFDSGRRTEIGGTLGRIEANQWMETIMVENHVTGEITHFKPDPIDRDLLNHGATDLRLAENFLNVLQGRQKTITPVVESLESHLACFATEIARSENRIVSLDEVRG